ncbi:MAG: hypothetical protein KDD62_12190, partial [Bdellovibrionales bacterium]|nr:hypothetical protein [Bdellovibrionales bacterium]
NAYTKHDVCSPPGRVLDTYIMAKKMLGELMNHRLETLVKAFGIEASNFHRACSDSHYCGQVFLRLLFELSKRKGILKMQHLLDLHDQELFFPTISPKAKQLGLL